MKNIQHKKYKDEIDKKHMMNYHLYHGNFGIGVCKKMIKKRIEK